MSYQAGHGPAWILRVDGTQEEIQVNYLDDNLYADVRRKYFNGETLDFTKVIFKGRLCHMAVDDGGHKKGLPYNEAATVAYRANCIPGTTHFMVGDVVVFDGLLS